ncbi:hypothetical protein ACFLTH_00745 [Bacteroidota bacterium]
MILKYFFAWFPMVIIAILNGSLRQLVINNYVSELAAHQISCITLIIFFGLYIYFVSLKWKIESCRQSWLIGIMWLCMTVIFEFGFFHYAAGHPWDVLLADYNIFEGRLWILVLTWVLIAPNIFYKFGEK